MKDAVKIVIIAAGERYFQQIIQYNAGRDPVIISMSSANLIYSNRKEIMIFLSIHSSKTERNVTF